MAHNYPKWPKNDARIYALFPRALWANLSLSLSSALWAQRLAHKTLARLTTPWQRGNTLCYSHGYLLRPTLRAPGGANKYLFLAKISTSWALTSIFSLIPSLKNFTFFFFWHHMLNIKSIKIISQFARINTQGRSQCIYFPTFDLNWWNQTLKIVIWVKVMLEW